MVSFQIVEAVQEAYPSRVAASDDTRSTLLVDGTVIYLGDIHNMEAIERFHTLPDAQKADILGMIFARIDGIFGTQEVVTAAQVVADEEKGIEPVGDPVGDPEDEGEPTPPVTEPVTPPAEIAPADQATAPETKE